MERKSIEKHEYFSGEIVAKEGATQNHNRIVFNISGRLHRFLLGKDCEGYTSDFRVASPLFESYMYPDVIIVCGEAILKDDCFDTLMNPTVVFEVMSRSTEQKDRGFKYFYYQKIASLREYILIDSNSCHAEVIRLDESRKWEIAEINGLEGMLYIQSIGMNLPMAEIYDRVSF